MHFTDKLKSESEIRSITNSNSSQQSTLYLKRISNVRTILHHNANVKKVPMNSLNETSKIYQYW